MGSGAGKSTWSRSWPAFTEPTAACCSSMGGGHLRTPRGAIDASISVVCKAVWSDADGRTT
jgi:hypothetical protein